MPSDWQLRTYDSVDAPYFASVPVTINGRLLDANLNDETIAKLRTFPADVRADVIISPLDKYLLFLYDEHNGFKSSVDGTAWMDDDGKLEETESRLSTKHDTVLLDTQVYRVNPLAGLLSTNAVMGSSNSQSVLIVKARLRMNELAAYLASRCTLQRANSSGLWDVARC